MHNEQHEEHEALKSLLQQQQEYAQEAETPSADEQPVLVNGTAFRKGHTDPTQVLKKYWGYDAFREKQLDIIRSILSGKDTIGLMPTGGGKSITFQVPGLMLPGLVLVITPLIALMEDQVAALKTRGIQAAAVHSGLTSLEIRQTLNKAAYGGLKFLYVSPERLSSENFLYALRVMKISFLAVDECHCISQWGYDFRPSYLNIKKLRTQYPKVPILALTATATKHVLNDVVRELAMEAPRIIVKSFARANLSYVVRQTDEKVATIAQILNSVPGTAIVYCRNRKLTGEIAQELKNKGFAADNYHAGMPHAERKAKQQLWMNDDIRVIVATNAFGMGIDKADVRTVIHWAMPSSLEEYYQEAGRAGRDGKQSYAVVLVGEYDHAELKRRVTTNFPDRQFIARVYDTIMSYLQIGLGDGYLRTYPFSIDHFLDSINSRAEKGKKLGPMQTNAAVHILDMAGVFLYDENSERDTRIMIVANKEELYNNPSITGRREAVLVQIMRRYTGVFTQYVYIDEEAIALATNLSYEDVCIALGELRNMKVIMYIPHSATPTLLMLTRREQGRLMQIPKSVLEGRKARFEERLKAVIDYVDGNNIQCRSQALLAYFDETDSPECGTCDLCRERRKRNSTEPLTQQQLIHKIEELARSLTQETGQVPLQQFLQALPQPYLNCKEAVHIFLEQAVDYRVENDILLRIG